MLIDALTSLTNINSLFDIFFMFLLETSFCPAMNKSGKRQLAFTLLATAIFYSAFIFFVLFFGFPYPGYLLYFMAFGTIFLIFADNRPAALVMVLFTVLGNAFIRFSIDAFLCSFIPGADETVRSYLLWSNIIILSVMLIYTLLLRRYCMNTSYYIAWYYELIFVCMLVLLFVFLYILSHVITDLSIFSLFMLLFLAATVISYITLQRLNKDQEKLFFAMMTKREESINSERFQEIQTLYQNMRVLRHEEKNNLFYIQTLIDLQEYEKLRDYAAELTHSEKYYITSVETGNILVNLILQPYMTKAAEQNVTIHVYAVLPGSLDMKDGSLVSLLSNLMSNAWENFNPEDPRIDVDLRIIKSYFSIIVENSVRENTLKQNPLLQTTKKNAQMHGIGTQVIKKIVSEYHGEIRFSSTDDSFSVNILLPMEPSAA